MEGSRGNSVGIGSIIADPGSFNDNKLKRLIVFFLSALLRFILVILVRLCYRLRVIGPQNVPAKGAALLVPNHVSWVDALLLGATSERRIRFVMEREIYKTPLLHGLFKLMGVIPVSQSDSRRELLNFVKEARAALDAGNLVCIFAEGSITRNGMLREFRSGFERIVQGSDYPIIPVYIGGAWGSILSYAHGRLLSKFPSLIPSPITVLFGAQMPSESTAGEVRQVVSELSGAYFDSRKESRRPLGDYFLSTAKKNWSRRAVADTSGKSLSYGRTAAGALALANRLEDEIGDATHVGVLLPPSAAGALVNLSLTLLSRIPVNLNYTAAESSIRSAISQCGISTIITSRVVLEKLPALRELEGTIFIEEVTSSISGYQKLAALLKARFVPSRLLCRSERFHADLPATVIFSSGSTGEPKGVMLSHHNIISNIEALRMVFQVGAGDNVCSALPFFHSLGFTGTLWFPLVSGFSAAYQTNPMDGEKIAEVVRVHKSTLLLATPTFLLAYLRRAKRDDFSSLRLVVTGAEKLRPGVADSFEEKFGIRPLEGYGATELSPVTALNLPDVELDGVRQLGSKQGSVGHPIPGVAIRVVDPETSSALKPGQTGMIQVKGPNVMLGYLNMAEKSAEAVKDGWYVTGDIGVMEEDGFIRITDRISRFSKIGGELVPHGAVEEELQNRLGKVGVLAVTAIPEEKKGERLIVLYEEDAADAESLYRQMAESPLPNLWKPARDSYFPVDRLPLLGTGKIDLKRVKEMALRLTEMEKTACAQESRQAANM